MTSISKEIVRAAIEDQTIVPDGHTIFYTHHYSPHFSEELLKKWKLVQTFKSDTSSHKATIFKDGEIVPEVHGVYNLQFLSRLARECGLELDWYPNGRGFEAQKWFAVLEAWATQE